MSHITISYDHENIPNFGSVKYNIKLNVENGLPKNGFYKIVRGKDFDTIEKNEIVNFPEGTTYMTYIYSDKYPRLCFMCIKNVGDYNIELFREDCLVLIPNDERIGIFSSKENYENCLAKNPTLKESFEEMTKLMPLVVPYIPHNEVS